MRWFPLLCVLISSGCPDPEPSRPAAHTPHPHGHAHDGHAHDGHAHDGHAHAREPGAHPPGDLRPQPRPRPQDPSFSDLPRNILASHESDDSEFKDPALRALDLVRHEDRNEVMALLEIPDAAVIADLGAGIGYFTFPLAQAAGPDGKVFAVEINPSYLDVIQKRMKRPEYPHHDNIVPHIAPGGELDLPEQSLDIAFIAHLDFYSFSPLDLPMHGDWLRKVRATVKPGGAIYVLQWFAVGKGSSEENTIQNFEEHGMKHRASHCFPTHQSCLLRFEPA